MTFDQVRSVAHKVFSLEMFMAAMAVVSGVVMTYCVTLGSRSTLVVVISGTILALSTICIVWLRIDPDSVRARNTAEVLELADQTYKSMEEGSGLQMAQQICELLLPATAGIAVAITDRSLVLGYEGFEEVENPCNKPITTAATHKVIDSGQVLICYNADQIGFPFETRKIKAGIIVPLKRGRQIIGTLKFYYRSSREISDTQVNLARGFGQLLSTQLSAKTAEEQMQLATSMELKALQAQINPHFLFNTINTISSFIRMDPARARTLLREFAVFYRQSLEETGDLVALSREMEQTQRYFHFEEARFGEDRLCLEVNFDDGVDDMLIPAFMIQPLVENAVRHARPAEGKLTIQVNARKEGDFLIVSVADDGVGMTEEQRQKLEDSATRSNSETGLGMAMKNVHDRVEGYFGVGSRMEIKSQLGQGTTVTLYMNRDSERLRAFIAERAEQNKTISAETISAGEVRSMAQVAEKSETIGVSDQIHKALSDL